MNLTINSREIQGVSILDLSGKIVLGEECSSLRGQVTKLLADGKKKILLNLGDVTRVDSSGIGLLVEALVLTAKEGGQLKLLNLPRLVHNTLALHRLLPAFDIYDKEDDSLASFK